MTNLHKTQKSHHLMKGGGRGGESSSRQIMCGTAALGNNAFNWRGKGAAWASVHIYVLSSPPSK